MVYREEGFFYGFFYRKLKIGWFWFKVSIFWDRSCGCCLGWSEEIGEENWVSNFEFCCEIFEVGWCSVVDLVYGMVWVKLCLDCLWVVYLCVMVVKCGWMKDKERCFLWGYGKRIRSYWGLYGRFVILGKIFCFLN